MPEPVCIGRISGQNQYLEIRETAYGGRGYFAVCDIPENTQVLICPRPFISTIFRPFRKEVCAYCFKYDDGRSWRIKLAKTKPNGPAFGGLYFCSQVCLENWSKCYDGDGLMSEALEQIERGAKQTAKNVDRDLDLNLRDVSSLSMADLDLVWESEEKKRLANSKMKLGSISPLDDSETDFARLIASCAVEKMRSECAGFDGLQSNELQQLRHFPGLLQAHIKIYRFLYTVLPPKISNALNSSLLRKTLGAEAGNAFGIWEQPLTLHSECFGTAVYPEASYFNHWCEPDVQKKRIDSSMVFTTKRAITQGQELHISYGMLEQQPTEQRKQLLRTQWYFDCQCPSCGRGD